MWITTGPAFAGSIVTSTSMFVPRISVENGSASAPRAGCELTRSDVVTSTAMPNKSSPATDQRRFRTSGSAGTVRAGPVGAVSVHGTAGIWGVLSIGLFASGDYGAGWNLTTSSLTKGTGVTGLFYSLDLGIRQLGAQAIGSLVIIFVMGGIAYGFFKLGDALTKGGIRPTAEVEDMGLDRPEMGALGYGDFATSEILLVGGEPSEDRVVAHASSPDPTIGR